MHSRVKFALLLRSVSAASLAAATFTYHIAGDDPGPWPQILSSIGLTRAAGGPANLFVVRNVAPGSVPQWIQRIEQGGIVVLEGESELAAALGIQPGTKRVMVRSIVDRRAPKLAIVWETAARNSRIRASRRTPRSSPRERWEACAGDGRRSSRHRRGAVDRRPARQRRLRTFPLLAAGLERPRRASRPSAASACGHSSTARTARAWIWITSPTAGAMPASARLHVAGWHYYEPNAETDEYLRRLIEACHRKAILVYVWLELPHVSEKFWDEHPEWREKTAHPAGRAAGLAQADEPDQSRLLRRGFAGA